jgi:hypothetical protein
MSRYKKYWVKDGTTRERRRVGMRATTVPKTTGRERERGFSRKADDNILGEG